MHSYQSKGLSDSIYEFAVICGPITNFGLQDSLEHGSPCVIQL